MFNKEEDPGLSRLKRAVEKWDSVGDSIDSALEVTWAGLTHLSIRTLTLARRHPRWLAFTAVSIALGSLAMIAHIGDDLRWGIPPPRAPLALGAGEGNGNSIAVSSLVTPLKEVYIPMPDTPDTKEAIDTSNWNTFRGKGFTLRYPSEVGWRATSNGIFLGSDGDEDVKISATAKALSGKPFAEFVAEQYAAHRQNRSGLVSSQQANFSAWNAAGVKGEVIGYETKSRPDGKTYDERLFMAYINGMVYQLVISQEVSQVQKTDPTVDRILNSLQIAGTSKVK